MNAPGDSALIFSLLAVFVACTGYAAGRLHQRWQAAQDREEAYRDGYESGTSSVFSTAVRMLGPKRPARGAAPVSTTKAPETEAENLEESDTPLGFPAPLPPPPYAVIDPPAIGGVVYRRLRDPRPADGSGPVMGEQPTKSPLPHPRTAEDSALSANLDEVGGPARPEDIKIHEEGDDAVSSTAPERSAAKQRRGGHRAKPAEEDTTINQAAAEPDLPAGRHTVPDELVRATTYRLPPDRIFRARVPENTPLPEEPTTRLPSVPKPRDES